jgi:hypothetical protein
VKNGQRVPKLKSISQFIGSAVFLVWLRAAQKSPALIFGPAAAIFRLAPVWHQVMLPSLLIVVIGMVQAAINLLRPGALSLGGPCRDGRTHSGGCVFSSEGTGVGAAERRSKRRR